MPPLIVPSGILAGVANFYGDNQSARSSATEGGFDGDYCPIDPRIKSKQEINGLLIPEGL
jgi:hypothetical protein